MARACIHVRDAKNELVDVAPYIYGTSSRIQIPGQRWPYFSDLERIRTDVGRLSVTTGMFGVQLSPVNLHEVKAGDRLLRLWSSGAAIRKNVIEINEVKVKDGHRKVFYFTILFPRREGGFKGLFSIDEFSRASDEWREAEAGLNRPDSLYLRYIGPADGNASVPSKSFFDKMADMASSFQTLVTAWTLAHVAEARSEKHISHDYYYGQWCDGFSQRHGLQFQHYVVGRVLSDVWLQCDLRGINKIYDDRRNVDLISPLLAQMQEDILVALGKNPDLTNVLFDPEAPDYWQRTLEVIFQEYFGPKGIIVLTAASADWKPAKPDRRLKILAGIIRSSFYEGERANAMALYKKLSGRDFIG